MKVIGITGGVGSGKSWVMTLLKEEFGAQIIKADEVARLLMEPGEEGYRKVTSALGTDFLRADGRIDRPLLSQRLFHDCQALETVNRMIHPMVWERIKEMVGEANSSLVAVEAALLGKECDDIYDELWYLYTSREKRIIRLAENRGYTEEKSLSIMANQPSEEEFLKHSRRCIDNNGSVEDTRKQIEAILKGMGQIG